MIASACRIASIGTGERKGQNSRSPSPRSARASASKRAFHDCGDKPKPAATAERPAKEPKAPPPDAPKGAEDGDAGVAGAAPSSRTPAAASTGNSTGKDAVVEQKSVDGGTQVFRFSEVEVEGRLKSPQIVYFLRRVRAEFAATDLGHRSFARELGETRNEPAFE